MKICSTILALLLFFSFVKVQANPFSAKIIIKSSETTQSTAANNQAVVKNRAVGVNFVIKQIQYQGKLNLPDKRAGVFFFKGKKYLVEEGEKIGNIKIVDFKKDYILLLKDKKLYKINKQ